MSDPTLRIFDRLAKRERKWFEKTFEQRHKTLAACGDAIKGTIATVAKSGWTDHVTIWNSALFLNTVSYDLSILVFDLTYERDDWRRRFVSRSLVLVVFEISEDIPAVFGKSFREAVSNLGISAELINQIGAETKKISAFWNDNREALKEIRTVAAAHRDHDAIRVHSVIDGLDLFDLHGLGIHVGALLNDLGTKCRAITRASSVTKPPVK